MRRHNATAAKLNSKTSTKAVSKAVRIDAEELNPTLRDVKLNGREIFRFPEVSGKILDKVTLYTSGENNAISLRFQDNTGLSFSIEPGFTARTEFFEVEAGEMRLLKEWPPIRSGSLRY